MMTSEIKARRASSPSIFNISATFLYTSPTNGVDVPKIIPSNSDTKTSGINNLVTLFKKAVRLVSVTFKFILLKMLREA